MKNLKTPFTVLAFVLTTMVACRKENQAEMTPPAAVPETAEAAVDSTQTGKIGSEWQQAAQWTEVKQPTHTVYLTHLKADISSGNADNALVRVFSQNGDRTGIPQSLPFEETVGSAKYYWYYTVTEGDVMLAVDVYGDAKNPGEKNFFKYMMFDEEAVSKLEAAGTSKADLISLPLEKLVSK